MRRHITLFIFAQTLLRAARMRLFNISNNAVDIRPAAGCGRFCFDIRLALPVCTRELFDSI